MGEFRAVRVWLLRWTGSLLGDESGGMLESRAGEKVWLWRMGCVIGLDTPASGGPCLHLLHLFSNLLI